MEKRVLFIHYRSGERDGVSLEIEKRVSAFEKQKWKTYIISGFDNRQKENIFVLPELDIKNFTTEFIRRSLFEKSLLDENIVIDLFNFVKNKAYFQLKQIISQVNPDVIFVHNLLSHAYNLPVTSALIELLDELKIQTISVNHDFWFERELFSSPVFPFVYDLLKKLPQNKDWIKNQVINSIVHTKLKQKGIESDLILDYWNFNSKMPVMDEFNCKIKKTLGIEEDSIVLLQATRVTYRKAIENSIQFCKILSEKIKNLECKKFGEKVVTKDTKTYLLLTNFVETGEDKYFRDLVKFSEQLNINLIFANGVFSYERDYNKGMFSFWDGYTIADLVMYPSISEGYGNQLLESFAFKKLPVVFEYPVFKADIRPLGFEFISLGDKIEKSGDFNLVGESQIHKAVEECIKTMSDIENLSKILEKNYNLAQKNNSIELFESFVEKNL